jgi:MFS family permease
MELKPIGLEISKAHTFSTSTSLNPPESPAFPPYEEPQKGISVLQGRIVLNPGITGLNYFASLIHVVLVMFSHTVTTTLQPLILLDPASFNIDKRTSGVVLAKLMLVQTVVKILVTPFIGHLIDKLGRRTVILSGAAICCFGYLLVPFQTSVFPGYVFSKVLVANGGNIMNLTPLNADYIHDSTKGKATGISLALGSFGQFLGTLFVAFLLGMKYTLPTMHVITGLTILGVASVYLLGVKGGKYYMNERRNEEGIERMPKQKVMKRLREGFKVLCGNGWLLISLTINTLARADYYLVTIIFALYVKSYDETAADSVESNHLVTKYQNLYFGLCLIGNLIYGQILDKVNALKIIIPTMGTAIMAYFLGGFADAKDSSLLLTLIIFAGMSMPGMLNAGNYLAIKNYPPAMRGVLGSLISIIGIAGYLFLSTVGGYLFDNWGRSAPFWVFACMLTASLTGVLIIATRGKLFKEEKGEKELVKAQDSEDEVITGSASASI